VKSSLIAIPAEHLTNRMAVEVEGGTMRKLRTVAASFAATGLAVFHGKPRSAGTVTSASGNQCLTARQSGKIDGAPLTVQRCVRGQVGQVWKVPRRPGCYRPR
jgi:hypothetical protein